MNFRSISKAAVLLTVVFTFFVGAAAPVSKSVFNNSHNIEQITILGSSSCSATAIGPYAVITASHCETPTDELFIDGTKEKIVKIIRDGNDHSILLFSGEPMKTYAKVSPNSFAIGDSVDMFGNPDGVRHIYRHGYIAGTESVRTGPFSQITYVLVDINGYFGDSGAGLFNDSGELIGIITKIKVENEETAIMKLMGILKMAFTKEQYDEAIAFQGK